MILWNLVCVDRALSYGAHAISQDRSAHAISTSFLKSDPLCCIEKKKTFLLNLTFGKKDHERTGKIKERSCKHSTHTGWGRGRYWAW